MVTATGDPAPG